MDRREALSALTGLGMATGAAWSDAKVIEAEPKPLLFVLRVSEPISESDVARIHAEWERLWQGPPPAPLAIVPQGATLDAILDPREKQNP